MRIASQCMTALAMAAAMAGAQAQTLTDPTKPPASLSATGTQSGSPTDQEAVAGTQLQSILFSGGRKLAVINGIMVPLGGMVGEARLVRITETQVVLKTGEATEVLKMYPGIEKRPVKRIAARQGEPK